VADARNFSTRRLSDDFMCRITTLSLELNTSFRRVLNHTHSGGGRRTFQWFTTCFSRCIRLRKLILTPTRYELPPGAHITYSSGDPIAREQELVDDIDELFGSTLEHLVFKWYPPMLPRSIFGAVYRRLNSADSFPALRNLEIPFSSGLSPVGTQDLEILPSTKILTYQISHLHPTLKILTHPTAPNDQPTLFSPPLVDLLHLPHSEIASYHAWLLNAFPDWNGSYLYPEVYPETLTSSLTRALQTLTFSGVAHGLTHYIPHRPTGPPHTLSFDHSFSALVAVSAGGLQSLTLETPPATGGAARWVRTHLSLLNSLRSLTVISRRAPHTETTAALMGAVGEFLVPLGISELKLHANVDARVVAGVLTGAELERMEVVGVGFLNEGSLEKFCAILGRMRRLREVGIMEWACDRG